MTPPHTRRELLDALDVERFTHLPQDPAPADAPTAWDLTASDPQWLIDERRDLLLTATYDDHDPQTLAGRRERAAQRMKGAA